MKNVERAPQPDSLKNNAAKWKRDLLNKINECKKTKEEVPSSFFNQYKKEDVSLALNIMYRGACCYCEVRVEPASFRNIEHLKPKNAENFPELTFEWENLHLSCNQCNTFKGTKYNKTNPILDPCKDIPVEKHLSYKPSKIGVLRESITNRGTTTVNHAKLNREGLRKGRGETLFVILELIGKINDNPTHPNTSTAIEELELLSKEEYGSLISWAMEKYMKPN